MTGFAVRRAHLEDLAALGELERGVFDHPWREGSLRTLLAAARDVVLAAVHAQDDGLLGYAAFLRLVDDAELLRLAVAPSARRRGVGRALVERGLEIHRAEGLVACHLEVRSDDRGAVGFYQRLGFETVGRRRSYYRDGGDALLMSRSL